MKYIVCIITIVLLLSCSLDAPNPTFNHHPVGDTPKDIGLWISRNIDYVADKSFTLHAMIQLNGIVYEYNGFKVSDTPYYDRFYGKTLYKYTFEEVIKLSQKYSSWQSPRETYRRGMGDCEDLSTLFAYFLWEQGHNPKIIIVEAKNQ
jgi:hypothetical protein